MSHKFFLINSDFKKKKKKLLQSDEIYIFLNTIRNLYDHLFSFHIFNTLAFLYYTLIILLIEKENYTCSLQNFIQLIWKTLKKERGSITSTTRDLDVFVLWRNVKVTSVKIANCVRKGKLHLNNLSHTLMNSAELHECGTLIVQYFAITLVSFFRWYQNISIWFRINKSRLFDSISSFFHVLLRSVIKMNARESTEQT